MHLAQDGPTPGGARVPTPADLAGLSADELQRLAGSVRRRLAEIGSRGSEAIAVIGVACRLPGGADDPDGYWRLLSSGSEAMGEVPADRWGPDAAGITNRRGGFLGDVGGFDPAAFGIAPREAVVMDPQHRLALEVAWEAVERSGRSPGSLAGRAVGVFLGLTSTDWRLRSAHEPWASDTYRLPGTGPCFAAGRISYVMGLRGPSVVVDTACSSSLSAVHLACQSLRAGESEMALAGGVNLILHPDVTLMASSAGMLSPEGRCKTFDASADGFTRGEGCGVVLLKRLADALEEGDPVLAVLAGSAMNQDGASSGLMVPNGLAQREVLRAALASAGVDPLEVQYVEAHGTGTRLGDPIEVLALQEVLAPTGERREPLLLGSVKTQIGHLEGAAGIAGLIKVVLAAHRGVLPPSLHFREPNPNIPWSEIDVRVADARSTWSPGGDGRRIAGVSAFGASGTNVHVVVTSAPPRERRDAGLPERPEHLFTVSAKTPEALAAYAGRFAAWLEETSVELADACRTANLARSDLRHRLAVPCASREELAATLRNLASGPASPHVATGEARGRRQPKVAFLFPGQGAQRVDTGRELYRTEPTFRAALDRCDEILRPFLDRPLLSVMHAPAGSGSAELLDDTRYAQPALFALGWSLAELWASWGVTPAAVVGHSVGEYVAACVAGVFGLEDGLRLVAERGRLMGSLPRHAGAMAVVFADEARTALALEGEAGTVSIAAVNGPANVVVSGDAPAVDRVRARLEAEGVRVRPLRVSHAFHSPLMDPVLEPFREAARAVRYAPPRLRLVSNLRGGVWGSGEAPDAEYWVRHLREPVRFGEGVRALAEQGCGVWIEMGPTPALLGMAREVLPDAPGVWVPALAKADGEWRRALASLGAVWAAGGAVDWEGFHHGWRGERVGDLPTYPFQRERFWIDVAPTAAPPEAEAEPAARASARLYGVAWERTEIPTGSPSSGTWLILSDRTGVGDDLVRRLEDGGARCVRVFSAGEGFAPADDALDPLDASAIEAAVAGAGPELAGAVHLWSLDSSAAGEGADPLASAVPRACGSALHLLNAVLHRGEDEAPPVWLVTRGSQAPAGAVEDPAAATLWGLARTAAAEHPGLRCVRVDLDPAGAAADSGSALARELGADGREDEVAFREGARLVPRLAPVEAGPVPVRIRDDGTYLVTGGLGGIGLRVAEWLVERGARHLVLVGRSGLGGAEDPRAAAVEALERRGARVLVARADVSSHDDVVRVVDEVRRTMPPLRGILHAAGVLDDGALSQQTWSRFAPVLAPKVAGARNLWAAAEGEPLELFVLFSSAAALVGSAGQANYAAANAFLDAFAIRKAAAGRRVVSVDWGPWADAGMAAGTSERDRRAWRDRGIELMPPAEALAALDAALASGAPHLAVLPVDWNRFLEPYAVGSEPSLLRRLRSAPAAPAGGDAAEDERRALVDRIRAAGPAEAPPLLERYLRAEAGAALGLPPERVPADEPLVNLGLDSLMAVHLGNRFRKDLGLSVTAGDLLEGRSVGSLVRLALQSREDAWIATTLERTSSPEELLSAVASLSEEQVEALLNGMLENETVD